MRSEHSPLITAAATAVACAVAWLAAGELAWPARAMTTFLMVIFPVLMLAQLRASDQVPGQVPRLAIYLSSAASIWLLAALAVVAALAGGFTPRLLGLTVPPLPTLAGWSFGVTGGGLLLMAAGRALGERESRLLVYLLPRSAPEKLAFVGLSLSAGIGEELVFRGFLLPALTAATGSLALATLLSSAVFGLVHAYQHTVGIVRAGLLGLVLAIPYLISGSILPSMVAHAALDIIAGLWLADWLLRRSNRS